MGAIGRLAHRVGRRPAWTLNRVRRVSPACRRQGVTTARGSCRRVRVALQRVRLRGGRRLVDYLVDLPQSETMSVEQNRALVLRFVEAVNRSDLDILDQVADGEIAQAARRWIGPFRESFPDFSMEIVDLIAESDKVVAHLWCSGTHEGEWHGIPATGRRLER